MEVAKGSLQLFPIIFAWDLHSCREDYNRGLVLRVFWGRVCSLPAGGIIYSSFYSACHTACLPRKGGFLPVFLPFSLRLLEICLSLLWYICPLTQSLIPFFCSLCPFQRRYAAFPPPPAYCCYILLSCSRWKFSLLLCFFMIISCCWRARPLWVVLLVSTCLPRRDCMG